jgi:hypothetical protein
VRAGNSALFLLRALVGFWVTNNLNIVALAMGLARPSHRTRGPSQFLIDAHRM